MLILFILLKQCQKKKTHGSIDYLGLDMPPAKLVVWVCQFSLSPLHSPFCKCLQVVKICLAIQSMFAYRLSVHKRVSHRCQRMMSNSSQREAAFISAVRHSHTHCGSSSDQLRSKRHTRVVVPLLS